MRTGVLFAVFFALGACDGGSGNGGVVSPRVRQGDVALVPVFEGLGFDFPVAMLQAPGDNTRWYVLERGGRIWSFANQADIDSADVFLDISDRVSTGGEGGLLGMAFHPDFAGNGQVFLSYTSPGAPLTSRIARFRRAGNALDPASEQTVLTLAQPSTNHNGGHLAFGPDGFLYIGFGDGGGGGDDAQNTANLFGALLRIDVNGAMPYAIPPDNPLVGAAGRGELWAWGLRNPWRFSFDRGTGELWLGDVGQDQWEEVDVIDRGGDYGWNIREGAHCFQAADCNTSGLIDPVAEYSHELGCSITGGYVYRGSAIPPLRGGYVFGDYCSGRVWALDPATARFTQFLDSDLRIVSFAEDNVGELYVVDANGGLFALVAAP
ncbi:MAG: sorbosone dehydrogenase family protein [Thiohalomonadaceae bacterium]